MIITIQQHFATNIIAKSYYNIIKQMLTLYKQQNNNKLHSLRKLNTIINTS